MVPQTLSNLLMPSAEGRSEAETPVSPTSGTHVAAHELVKRLPSAQHRQMLMSTLAVLLGRGLQTWGQPSAQWVDDFLARIVTDLVCAAEPEDSSPRRDSLKAQLEALRALCNAAAAFGSDIDPSPLVAELPRDAREPCLTLLVSYAALPHTAGAQAGVVEGGYDARSRQLLKGLCAVLQTGAQSLACAEDALALNLAQLAATREAPQHAKKGRTWAQTASIVGAATVGGVLIAATAGLAAPAFGLGLAALGSASIGGFGITGAAAVLGPVATFLGTSAGAVTFTTLFGATGASLSGIKVNRLLSDVSDFGFARLDGRPRERAPDAPAAAPAAAAPAAEPSPPSSSAQRLLSFGSSATSGLLRAASKLPSRVVQLPSQMQQMHKLPAQLWRGQAELPLATLPPAKLAEPPPRLSLQIVISGWRRTADESAAFHWSSCYESNQAALGGGAPADGGAAALLVPPCERAQPFAEQWALEWERDELLRLGETIDTALASEAGSMAYAELLKHTALATLMSAIALPTLVLRTFDAIDNPWAVAQARADKTGKYLAQVLLAREHGARPVSLSGFGLGARVALVCAHQLYKAGDKGRGLLEDLTLLGTPVETSSKLWAEARAVAAGRIVSCYSSNDWVLALLFRAQNLKAITGVSGLGPVPCAGVLSVDVSDLVVKHSAYSEKLELVLARAAQAGTTAAAPRAAADGTAAAVEADVLAALLPSRPASVCLGGHGDGADVDADASASMQQPAADSPAAAASTVDAAVTESSEFELVEQPRPPGSGHV